MFERALEFFLAIYGLDAVWKVALFYRLFGYLSPLKSISVRKVSPSGWLEVEARLDALPLDGGFRIDLGVCLFSAPLD